MDRYLNANAVLSLFSKEYMELKKGLPIRPSEMGVLNIISETEGVYTPVKLAEMLQISKPMITAHITVLVNKGYVTKEPSLTDKRAYYVRPTEEGRKLVTEAGAEQKRLLERIENAIGTENFDIFIEFAKTALEIMEYKSTM